MIGRDDLLQFFSVLVGIIRFLSKGNLLFGSKKYN